MSSVTPKFLAPPLIETVLGVEFEPLSSWDIPHYGLFWQSIRQEYQNCIAKPPLISQLELIEPQETKAQDILNLRVIEKPDVRCWYVNIKEDWLMQVQDSRFLHNWRKGNSPYPHYAQVKERFLIAWNKFNEFLVSEGLPAPIIKQCEITYINHIELAENESWEQLHQYFPSWTGNPSSPYLANPEAVVLQSSYRLPENKGRLRIVMQPAIRHTDLKHVIQLEVTVRVIMTPQDNLQANLDLGHEWVVNGFADFTSTALHTLWKRKIEKDTQ